MITRAIILLPLLMLVSVSCRHVHKKNHHRFLEETHKQGFDLVKAQVDASWKKTCDASDTSPIGMACISTHNAAINVKGPVVHHTEQVSRAKENLDRHSCTEEQNAIDPHKEKIADQDEYIHLLQIAIKNTQGDHKAVPTYGGRKGNEQTFSFLKQKRAQDLVAQEPVEREKLAILRSKLVTLETRLAQCVQKGQSLQEALTQAQKKLDKAEDDKKQTLARYEVCKGHLEGLKQINRASPKYTLATIETLSSTSTLARDTVTKYSAFWNPLKSRQTTLAAELGQLTADADRLDVSIVKFTSEIAAKTREINTANGKVDEEKRNAPILHVLTASDLKLADIKVHSIHGVSYTPDVPGAGKRTVTVNGRSLDKDEAVAELNRLIKGKYDQAKLDHDKKVAALQAAVKKLEAEHAKLEADKLKASQDVAAMRQKIPVIQSELAEIDLVGREVILIDPQNNHPCVPLGLSV